MTNYIFRFGSVPTDKVHWIHRFPYLLSYLLAYVTTGSSFKTARMMTTSFVWWCKEDCTFGIESSGITFEISSGEVSQYAFSFLRLSSDDQLPQELTQSCVKG